MQYRVPQPPVLDPFGSFTVVGQGGCPADSHIVARHPALTGLTDADLSNWGCSTHEGFVTWPTNFLVLAISKDVLSSFVAPDGTTGAPYIIARGERLAVPKFLRFPVDAVCSNGRPCDAYTAYISSVQDHSVPTGYNCNSTHTCDGIIRAFTNEVGNSAFGSNSSPPGYPKDNNGSRFYITDHYIGVTPDPCKDGSGVPTTCFPKESYLNYDGHSGYDYSYSGKPILAAADGTLEVPVADPVNNPNSNPHDKFNSLQIVHDNGYETWYLHAIEGSECIAFHSDKLSCSPDSTSRPKPGDKVAVKAGQQIGIVGSTCHGAGCPLGPHLHFEVRDPTRPTNDPDYVVDPYLTGLWITPRIAVAVHSPVELHVYDSAGNHVGPRSIGGIDREIADSSYEIRGEEKFANMPAGPSYRIVLKGLGTGTFDFDITETESDQVSVINEVHFLHVPVTPSMLAETTFMDVNSSITLLIDVDGNGTIDKVISPVSSNHPLSLFVRTLLCPPTL